MAVAIPVVAAFAGAAAGIATATAVGATALSIAAGYAMVAGSVLTGIGALSGKKDLMRVGGVLSLVGGIGAVASAASGAAASTTGAGSGATAAGDAAATAGGAAASGTGAQAAATTAAGTGSAANMNALAAGQSAADVAASGGSLMDSAWQNAFGATEAASYNAGARAFADPVAQAASNTTSAEIAANIGPKPSIMDSISGWGKTAATKIGDMGTGAVDKMAQFGTFAKNNKELLQLGGNTLNAMFGPEAELNDLRRQQIAKQRSLLDRAYRNLNDPVVLYRQPLAGER